MNQPEDDLESGGETFDHRIPWERTIVNSRAEQRGQENHTGLGDPLRWGTSAEIDVKAVENNYGVTFKYYSQMLARIMTDDPYPRNWQIVGTLDVPSDWATSPIEDLKWLAILDLYMGVGQATIHHRVNLRALINLAMPPALIASIGTYYYPVQNGNRVSFPWILPGGVTARALQARVAVSAQAGADPVAVGLVGVSLAVSPFAATFDRGKQQ